MSVVDRGVVGRIVTRDVEYLTTAGTWTANREARIIFHGFMEADKIARELTTPEQYAYAEVCDASANGISQCVVTTTPPALDKTVHEMTTDPAVAIRQLAGVKIKKSRRPKALSH